MHNRQIRLALHQHFYDSRKILWTYLLFSMMGGGRGRKEGRGGWLHLDDVYMLGLRQLRPRQLLVTHLT